MKRTLLSLLTLFVATTAIAQAQKCDPENDPNKTCTVGGARAFYREKAATTKPVIAEEEAANNATAMQITAKNVVTANRATTPPQTFAGRIHNSYEDFLNLFSFAINKVDESDNGQALIIRFNPLRQGDVLIGTTLTAAQPAVSDLVKNAIPEATRDDVVKKLEGRFGDRNDLTYSASVSGATKSCDNTRPATARCWGRTPSTYRPVIDQLLLPLVRSDPDAIHRGRLLSQQFNGRSPTNSQIVQSATSPPEVIRLLKDEAGVERERALTAREIYEANHLDLIATMIDNQPQATGTLTVHRPALYGGPRSQSVAVELHFGRMNINTLRERCATKAGDELPTCLHDELAKLAGGGMATDKWVFNASYDRALRYQVGSLGLDQPVDGFTAIDLARNDVLKVKGQGGLQVPGTDVKGKPMRADFSIEGGFNQKGKVRSDNRWVGTATFSVPFGDMLTIPVSVSWANKSEFVGDVKQHIGAHVGISYRLPELFGSK